MSDRERFNLRGAVKHCEVHRTMYWPGCGPDASETEERTDMTIVEFRPDGSLECHWVRNPPPNSSEWTHHYDYNDSGQLTVVRGEVAGDIKPIRIYEYDSEGRISKLKIPDKEGIPQAFETYTYDADGRKTKITHAEEPPPGQTCGPQGCGIAFFGLDGTEIAYGAEGAVTITSIYDKHSRPTEHLLLDKTGELVTRVDFTYDDRGNLVEEVSSRLKLQPHLTSQFNAQQLETLLSMFRFHHIHRYDEHNRKIEKLLQRAAPHNFERVTFEYNDYGDIISQISEDRGGGGFDVAEDGQLIVKEEATHYHQTESRFRYQYDPHGNWTEKITESADGRIGSIERRTITYYDAPQGHDAKPKHAGIKPAATSQDPT